MAGDNAGDQTIENTDEGTDTVRSSIGTTLGANLDNLIPLDFSKPELGRITGIDGVARDALVYGFPTRFELTSMANLLTQSGESATGGDVARRAIDNRWMRTPH